MSPRGYMRPKVSAGDSGENDKKIRVLVTGSGYIAEHTVKRLLSEGYEVRYSYRREVAPFGEEVIGVRMDLRDEASCAVALWKTLPDVIIHTAAISSPAACEKDAELAFATNCPTAFLEACFAVVPDALFVQLSTDIVLHGREESGSSSIMMKQKEKSLYQDGGASGIQAALRAIELAEPVNVYGRSKLAFEKRLVEAWPRTIILRLSNVLGPSSPYTKLGKFTQWLMNTLQSQGTVSLWYDEIRSFLHVDQLLDGFCAIIQRYAIAHQPCSSQARLDDLTTATKPGETAYYEREVIRSTYPPLCVHLNLGGPEPLSRLDVGKIIAARLGLDQDNALVPTSRSTATLSYPSPLDVAMDSSNFQRTLRIPLLRIQDAPSGF